MTDLKLSIREYSGVDKRYADGLTVHAHLATDGSHGHAVPRETNSLGLFVTTEPGMAPGYLPAPEVSEDGGAMDAILLRQLLGARPGLVVGDQMVDL
ncbi:hypothetical protein [Propionibacterium acidifaciens]|uniref:hypothetical protein n=1 Tax=Propionibacterium acidifaciens TaxID=556499 RepID=UPI0028DC4ECA|nr:hypothetical protein [Propionibacterium acidifaciens]